jgi:hypothetical protein
MHGRPEANRSEGLIRVLAVKLWETTERWELQDLSVLTDRDLCTRPGTTLRCQPDHRDGPGAWVGDDWGSSMARYMKRSTFTARTCWPDWNSKDRISCKLRERIAGFAGLSTIY